MMKTYLIMNHIALLYLFASNAFANSTAESSADIVISNDSLLGVDIKSPPYVTVKQVITQGAQLELATFVVNSNLLEENNIAIGINNSDPISPYCTFAENKNKNKMHVCLDVDAGKYKKGTFIDVETGIYFYDLQSTFLKRRIRGGTINSTIPEIRDNIAPGLYNISITAVKYTK
ncbi:hypothetical protein H9X98_22940 [Aeromonas jandaei]|uniref:hypothetical protein n=1 Tax=Aeromonas jandaei TaxID=650 RepID=UPI001F1B5462|nr:hypothetical protein [Aeromonas jandaei]MCF7718073.1 hypothetical protein [Aeromonas jandaei]MCF7720504.1 hypothetical protein [Aeromonas jandaei]